MNNPVARILDVNLNRAGEALRTLEEYARFVMNSAPLAGRCKRLRHRLNGTAKAWAESLPAADRPAANRDIAGDVGAGVKTPREIERPDALSVAAAAARRAAEALRTLSEYGKIDNAPLAAEFEDIRYRLYDLEPLLLADADLRRRLAAARLYVIVTARFCSAEPLVAAREALAGGADVVQMREKEMEDGEFFPLAEKMCELCREAGAVFLVNDRPHIANLVDAGGVHGGQGDLPTHLIRRILGPEKIIGRSTSAPEFAERALADGADYIGVGPVHETNTKRHRRAVGLEYVSWAAKWGGLPYFAIGGINRDSIGSVIGAGARAVAICTAVTMAPDIAAEAAYFKNLLTANA